MAWRDIQLLWRWYTSSVKQLCIRIHVRVKILYIQRVIFVWWKFSHFSYSTKMNFFDSTSFSWAVQILNGQFIRKFAPTKITRYTFTMFLSLHFSLLSCTCTPAWLCIIVHVGGWTSLVWLPSPTPPECSGKTILEVPTLFWTPPSTHYQYDNIYHNHIPVRTLHYYRLSWLKLLLMYLYSLLLSPFLTHSSRLSPLSTPQSPPPCFCVLSLYCNNYVHACIQDYWLSVLHKRLVGVNVLNVSGALDHGRHVRVYAHCARQPWVTTCTVLVGVLFGDLADFTEI